MNIFRHPPDLELLEENEILMIDTKDLILQRDIKKQEKEKNTKALSSGRKNIFSWVLSHLDRIMLERVGFLHTLPSISESALSYPKVFVLHRRGQELPKGYLKRVPPDTILVVIGPEDFPKHNVFEARPITSRHLKKVSQCDESSCNKHLDA